MRVVSLLASCTETVCRLGGESTLVGRSRPIFLADGGNQFFNRPGPRIVESLQILAEICHPDEFGFLATRERVGFAGRADKQLLAKPFLRH